MKKINLQFFGQVIDLTDRLSEEKSAIKIGDDTYEINDGFKTILEVDALMKRKDISQVEQLSCLFKTLFGDQNGEKLMSKNYKINFYKEILEVAMNTIKGNSSQGK